MTQPSDRLALTFSRLRSLDQVGLFPYLTVGFPSRAHGLELLEAIAEAGADGLELGIPFSDPLADGVTMQRASARALEQKVTLDDALELVRRFRIHHNLPISMMSYVNPLLAYGLERLCRDGASAGIDGLIVPDLPFEESAQLAGLCVDAGIHLIQLVAPTTGPERLAAVCERASGFIYCVTLVGTTGARATLSSELPEFLAAVRAATRVPLVAGFGIATPAHVAALADQVDGVIVASALADFIEQSEGAGLLAAVDAFIRDLKASTKRRLPIDR